MSCFTKNTEVVEEQNDEGIVSGHAYTILDAQMVVDSSGKEDYIIQIRNPWGSFEWNGKWADNSTAWTEDLKDKLLVHRADDGLFWISIFDFVKFYRGVGIGKVEKDYVFSSIYIQSNKK